MAEHSVRTAAGRERRRGEPLVQTPRRLHAVHSGRTRGQPARPPMRKTLISGPYPSLCRAVCGCRETETSPGSSCAPGLREEPMLLLNPLGGGQGLELGDPAALGRTLLCSQGHSPDATPAPPVTAGSPSVCSCPWMSDTGWVQSRSLENKSSDPRARTLSLGERPVDTGGLSRSRGQARGKTHWDPNSGALGTLAPNDKPVRGDARTRGPLRSQASLRCPEVCSGSGQVACVTGQRVLTFHFPSPCAFGELGPTNRRACDRERGWSLRGLLRGGDRLSSLWSVHLGTSALL